MAARRPRGRRRVLPTHQARLYTRAEVASRVQGASFPTPRAPGRVSPRWRARWATPSACRCATTWAAAWATLSFWTKARAAQLRLIWRCSPRARGESSRLKPRAARRRRRVVPQGGGAGGAHPQRQGVFVASHSRRAAVASADTPRLARRAERGRTHRRGHLHLRRHPRLQRPQRVRRTRRPSAPRPCISAARCTRVHPLSRRG